MIIQVQEQVFQHQQEAHIQNPQRVQEQAHTAGQLQQGQMFRVEQAQQEIVQHGVEQVVAAQGQALLEQQAVQEVALLRVLQVQEAHQVAVAVEEEDNYIR